MTYLTHNQNQLRDHLANEVRSKECALIEYRSEWLGWLPYGLYHWITFEGRDISPLSFEWNNGDLAVLEQSGFLETIGAWQNPNDEFEKKTLFRVHVRPNHDDPATC